MARDREIEKKLSLSTAKVGERVRYWRQVRGMEQGELAKAVRLKQSSLSDLETGRSSDTKRLGEIAAKLGLRLTYLREGGEDPELKNGEAHPQITPDMILSATEWPFPSIPRERIERLRSNPVEMHFLESRMLEALATIEDMRRKSG